ncbi:MAG: hypothetical protein WBW51_13265 [Methyloceanibacter sp.]
MRSAVWASVVETKLRRLERVFKANFDPNQPRVPAGNPDGGQWTSTGGGGEDAASSLSRSPTDGM